MCVKINALSQYQTPRVHCCEIEFRRLLAALCYKMKHRGESVKWHARPREILLNDLQNANNVVRGEYAAQRPHGDAVVGQVRAE